MGLLPSAHGSRHGIHAGCAKFGQVRLQTGLNPAAARLDARTDFTDVAAAFVRNRGNPKQCHLARPRKIGQVRVKTGSDGAATRSDVPTCRPDIRGTFSCDRSLLRN
jgi:hypothetical protein